MACDIVTPLLSSLSTCWRVFLMSCSACDLLSSGIASARSSSLTSVRSISWTLAKRSAVLTWLPVLDLSVSMHMSWTCLTIVSCSEASLLTSVYLSMMMAMSMFIMSSIITIMYVQNQKAAVRGFSSPSSSQSKSPSISRKHFETACEKELNSQSRLPKMNMPAMTYDMKTIMSTIRKWKSSLAAEEMVLVTTANRGCAENDSRNFRDINMVYQQNINRTVMR
mmetsp:Transcript_12864/g.29186  ORF Transcript_12864/g.29186 Transcript_12864/m.29186 type:complete len:223 (+) Transcript_12864:656-1324(+)